MGCPIRVPVSPTCLTQIRQSLGVSVLYRFYRISFAGKPTNSQCLAFDQVTKGIRHLITKNCQRTEHHGLRIVREQSNEVFFLPFKFSDL